MNDIDKDVVVILIGFMMFTKWIMMDSLQNRGMGLDMKVQEAWALGVTGKGTVVTILDDGLEKDHPDLRRNYVTIFPFFSLL